MTTTNKCRQHPEKDAPYTCASCQAPFCDACLRERADGALVCAPCFEGAPEPLELIEPDSGAYDVKDGPPSEPGKPMAPATSMFGACHQHPKALAVARCSNCTNGVCATCDFAFPGGVHLCPSCATDPKQKLTPKRKMLMYWSIGLGIMNLLIVIGIELTIGLGMVEVQEALVVLGCFGCICLLTSPIGLGMGIAAFSKRSHNPGLLWLGPILNGLAIADRIFVIILTQMRGG